MKKTIRLVAVFLLAFLLTSCASAQGVSHTSPTPAPAFVDGYQIHPAENTFLLQIPIRPDPQRDTELILSIDGSLDERQYFLLAQNLRVLDAKTGEERQSFPLSYYDEPLLMTTLPMIDDISAGVIVEDLNFDGYTDFRISAEDGVVYFYWTWDAHNKQFDKDTELEALNLRYPEFDATEHTILSRYADSATDSEERMYQYIDGTPKLVKWVKCSFDSDIEKLHVITAELQDGGLFVKEEYVEE